MTRRAPADYPIHDLLLERWSPRAFADRLVEPAVLQRLFEAARWTGVGRQAVWGKGELAVATL